MKTGKRTIGPARCRLGYSALVPASLRGRVLELSALEVDEDKRGKGLGTALLFMVCKEADSAGKSLLLKADTTKLEFWYARHGFEAVGDGLMLRKPR